MYVHAVSTYVGLFVTFTVFSCATCRNGSGDMSSFYFIGYCLGHEDRLDDCQHFPVFPTICSQSVSVSCSEWDQICEGVE